MSGKKFMVANNRRIYVNLGRPTSSSQEEGIAQGGKISCPIKLSSLLRVECLIFFIKCIPGHVYFHIIMGISLLSYQHIVWISSGKWGFPDGECMHHLLPEDDEKFSAMSKRTTGVNAALHLVVPPGALMYPSSDNLTGWTWWSKTLEALAFMKPP